MRARAARLSLVLGSALVLLLGVAWAQQRPEDLPVSTEDRLTASGWWPTRPGERADAYAGSGACAECHADEAGEQSNSAMGQAATRIATGIPGAPDALSGRSGEFTYSVFARESEVEMQVSSGDKSDTASVAWAMGANVHGQTYLLSKGGQMYESQLSRFRSLAEMDLTPGHRVATNFEHALGAKLTTGEIRQCAGCHMTASWTEAGLDLKHAVPGVQCEACHGPGAAHIRAVRAGHAEEAQRAIAHPSTLSAKESIDFCGACHRTSMDVLLEQKELGVGTVRFQPYRLEESRCWQRTEDARLSCVGCHDPHRPLEKEATRYDSKCLSCHGRTGSTAAAHVAGSRRSCPKAVAGCTTCHMPKYPIADMHAEFTDHDIRVVRPGEKFPN